MTDAGIRKGEFSIFLEQNEALAERIHGSEVVIGVEGIEQVYANHIEKGVTIISDLEEKPWGAKEYSIKDPNGYILRFGE